MRAMYVRKSELCREEQLVKGRHCERQAGGRDERVRTGFMTVTD
jgi:hypothetical protein